VAAGGSIPHLLLWHCPPLRDGGFEEAKGAAITIAATTGACEITELLLFHGAPVFVDNHQPLRQAAVRGFLEVVTVLLDYIPDVQTVLATDTFELIHQVAHTGNLEMTTCLFEQLTAEARTECLLGRRRLLIDAIDNGNAGIVELLLSASGANSACVETLRRVDIDKCIDADHVALVKVIARVVHKTPTGRYTMMTHVLCRAAAVGHVPLVTFAVNYSTNTAAVVAVDSFLPIRLAAHHGHTEVIRVMLDRASDHELALRALNDSPVRFAARGGHLHTLHFLINEIKNPVQAIRAMDDFALQWALHGEHKRVVAYVIEAGHYTVSEVDRINNRLIHSVKNTQTTSRPEIAQGAGVIKTMINTTLQCLIVHSLMQPHVRLSDLNRDPLELVLQCLGEDTSISLQTALMLRVVCTTWRQAITQLISSRETSRTEGTMASITHRHYNGKCTQSNMEVVCN
jgi:ankyrin repeat protein